jgi:biopolymer transport protein ExbD
VSNAQQQPRPDKPIFVTLKGDLSLTLGDETIARDALGAALDRATEADHDKRIFLRADKSVPYGELMKAMNLLRDAGYLKIALVGLEDAK